MKHYKELYSQGVSILEIDMKKIIHNYKTFSKLSRPGIVSAVVKANAYGCGVEEISKTLFKNGCEFFFVAKLEEGIKLREFLPEKVKIGVFDGIYEKNESIWKNFKLNPVCNTLGQLKFTLKNNIKSILHVDTGMNRLGISISEFLTLKNKQSYSKLKSLILIMSHLSSSDEPNSKINNIQIKKFNSLENVFPTIPRSLANSHGIFLGKDAIFNITRLGIGLYGYVNYNENKFKPAVRVLAPILQIRNGEIGDHVGYNATVTLKKKTKIGVLGIGYADGFKRILGKRKNLFLGKYKIKVLGRISMDTLTVDFTNVPDQVLKNIKYLPLIDEFYSISNAASDCETIPYEILTSFGNRLKRVYI